MSENDSAKPVTELHIPVGMRDSAGEIYRILEGLASVIDLCKCSDAAMVDAGILEPIGVAVSSAAHRALELRMSMEPKR